jgi:hypothetical protein
MTGVEMVIIIIIMMILDMILIPTQAALRCRGPRSVAIITLTMTYPSRSGLRTLVSTATASSSLPGPIRSGLVSTPIVRSPFGSTCVISAESGSTPSD